MCMTLYITDTESNSVRSISSLLVPTTDYKYQQLLVLSLFLLLLP